MFLDTNEVISTSGRQRQQAFQRRSYLESSPHGSNSGSPKTSRYDYYFILIKVIMVIVNTLVTYRCNLIPLFDINYNTAGHIS